MGRDLFFLILYCTCMGWLCGEGLPGNPLPPPCRALPLALVPGGCPDGQGAGRGDRGLAFGRSAPRLRGGAGGGMGPVQPIARNQPAAAIRSPRNPHPPHRSYFEEGIKKGRFWKGRGRGRPAPIIGCLAGSPRGSLAKAPAETITCRMKSVGADDIGFSVDSQGPNFDP